MTVQSVSQGGLLVRWCQAAERQRLCLPYQDRTAWEFVNLANEMAQRIAYDTRDWTGVAQGCVISRRWRQRPVAILPLPADYQAHAVDDECLALIQSTNSQ